MNVRTTLQRPPLAASAPSASRQALRTKIVSYLILGVFAIVYIGPLLMLVNNATRLTGGVIDRTRLAASDLSWLLTRRYGFGTDRPSPALVSYVERMNSRTSAETITRYARTLLTHSRYPALAVLAPNPTLVIAGDKDMITPVTHSEEIVRWLPDADYVRITDGGHVVMLEHADEVNAALFAFLAKIRL